MIITTITSGLGNQLYQYAFGRVLALRHRVPLKQDPYWFQHAVNTASRTYGLSHFAIEAPEATWQELDGYIHADTRWHRLVHPYYRRVRIRERAFRYDGYKRFPAQTYVEGFWQAWPYYADYHEPLRREFRLVTLPTDAAARLLDEVSRPATVALHVRRGDYTTNAAFNTLPPAYYVRAVDYLQQRHAHLRWYVFSDDMAWVRRHVDLPQGAVLVEGLADVDDFRLMNATQHSIVANSLFSWWSAWLKPLGGRTIVAPQVPFTDPNLWPGDELYPPHFVRC